MIKGGLSGKLLKQSFIILLISCFTLLGNSFVNALDCDGYSIEGGRGFGFDLGQYGLTFDPNTTLGQSCDNLMDFDGSIDGNFNFNDGVFNWGSTLSSREGTFFWRTSEGLKYQIRRSSSSSVYNGTIVGFFSCSSEPTLGSYYYLKSLGYCSYHSGFDSLSTYLEGAESWGYVFKLVNSSDTNGFLCVYSNNNYICMDRSYAINTSNTLISYSEAKSEAISNPFSNNNNLPYTPPSMSGTGNIIPGQMSGDYLVNKCTYGEILNYLQDAGYSKYLCYGGLDNFDLYDSSLNYNPIPGTGKTLQQIVSYSNAWDTPYQWFNYWDGLRGGYTAMRESYPAVYKTRFDFYYIYGQGVFYFPTVLEYCNILELDIDYNSTVYNGQYFKTMCTDAIKNPGNSDDAGSVGVNLDGIGGRTGYTTYVNGDTFIQDYFNLLKEKFPTKYDLGLGFLPGYIIFFLLALVFFRFLAH